jgi:hypothetical protein
MLGDLFANHLFVDRDLLVVAGGKYARLKIGRLAGSAKSGGSVVQ